MKIYDQHLHSFLSFDSNEKWENYLKKAVQCGVEKFVTTEHLDLKCNLVNCDLRPDFTMQAKLINQLQTNYPTIKLLKGVEAGYKLGCLKETEKIISEGDFDVVIMSVHENENLDLATSEYLNMRTPEEAYKEYLDLYSNLLDNCNDFDILGHVDYLLRYIDKVNIEKYEKQFFTIFEKLIKKEKSLECNTRFIYAYNDLSYLYYIFDLYYKCGGRKVSLGSDGHSYNVFMGGFDKAKKMLEDIGFKKISTYEKRKEINIDL